MSLGQKVGGEATQALVSGQRLDGIVWWGMLMDGATRISLFTRPGLVAANMAQMRPPVEWPMSERRRRFAPGSMPSLASIVSIASRSQSAALATANRWAYSVMPPY